MLRLIVHLSNELLGFALEFGLHRRGENRRLSPWDDSNRNRHDSAGSLYRQCSRIRGRDPSLIARGDDARDLSRGRNGSAHNSAVRCAELRPASPWKTCQRLELCGFCRGTNSVWENMGTGLGGRGEPRRAFPTVPVLADFLERVAISNGGEARPRPGQRHTFG